MGASDYIAGSKLNANPRYAFIITLIIHLVIIGFVLKVTEVKHIFYSPSSLQMIHLDDVPHTIELEPQSPSITFAPGPAYLDIPIIEFSSYHDSPADLSITFTPYELPDKNSEQYKDIFDPRLRKKLLEAQAMNHSRTAGKLEGWTEIDGRVFIEMGDGLCRVSMPNSDTHSTATNWGVTSCHKTDSEKAMDRVNADIESRRQVLKK